MDENGARPDGSQVPEDEQAIPSQFLFQATLGVFLLVVLLLAAGLPGRLGLPALALVISTPTTTPTRTVFVTPTPRPPLIVPPTPVPTPAITPTPLPLRYVVANTGGDGAALRNSPSKAATTIAGWPDSTVVVEVGSETTGDGVTWKQVRDPKGNVGYMQAQYLSPLPPGG